MNTDASETTGATVDLMRRAQGGDRSAFDELSRRAVAVDKPADLYYSGWSSRMDLLALQARVGGSNLLARACVESDLAEARAGLAEPGDGPVERLIVERAAVAIVEARKVEVDHFRAIDDDRFDRDDVEMYERRRDRSIRRTLSLLKCLCDVRRLNRRVVQVNIGDGNLNVLRV